MKERVNWGQIVLKFLLALLAIALLLLMPAGKFLWVEAWHIMLLIFIYAVFIAAYLKKNQPELLGARASAKLPKRSWDRKFMSSMYLGFIFLLVIPALDYRFGWSDVSTKLEAVMFCVSALSLLFVGIVMRENPFLTRDVKVSRKQTVVTTGPYALVRHPMYAAFFVFILALPLALGSFWGLIPAMIINAALITRTSLEDKALIAGLKGYKRYAEKTKYKLLPLVW